MNERTVTSCEVNVWVFSDEDTSSEGKVKMHNVKSIMDIEQQ